MMAEFGGARAVGCDSLRRTSGDQRCGDGNEFGQLRRSSPGKRGASLLSCVVARKSVCLRRVAGGKRSEIVRYGRFLDNRKVTVGSLIEGWGKQTAHAVAGRHVLAIHDTSEINFRTTPERRRGLGEIAKGNSHGVLLHAMLAVDAQSGDSLGLVAGEIWTRQGRQTLAHDKRAASERESRRWLSTALAAKQVLSAALMVTVIGDRESDIYSAWTQAPEDNFHLLSRSMQDRNLVGGGSLDATVAGWPVAAHRTLELVERGGRPARRAALEMRFGEVTIQRPRRCDHTLPEGVRLRVIEVSEPNPPANQDPLRWCLLTTHQVQSPNDAWQIVAWYKLRWTIEQLFRTLKRQGLQLEDSQVETADRLLKLTAIATHAAALIMQLVQARDGQRVQPASIAFSDDEIDALQAIEANKYAPRTEKQRNPHPTRSLAWAAWIVAQLGGWDGYSSSKPPGPITFKHGIDYFKGIAVGWALRNV
jgi:Transposase DDE domain